MRLSCMILIPTHLASQHHQAALWVQAQDMPLPWLLVGYSFWPLIFASGFVLSFGCAYDFIDTCHGEALVFAFT